MPDFVSHYTQQNGQLFPDLFLKTPAAPRSQKRKKNGAKTRKSSSAVEGQTTEHSSTSPVTGEDSDSDSSLDVEKWKRLALQLSG